MRVAQECRAEIEPVRQAGQVAPDPAFANALRDATGVRFTEVPLLRAKVWLALEEHRAQDATPDRPSRRHPPHEGSA